MTTDNELLSEALRLLSAARGTGLDVLIAIWLLYRQRRYSNAALARQQQQALRLVNETWKTAFETVLREQPRRLQDLVEDIETELSLKP